MDESRATRKALADAAHGLGDDDISEVLRSLDLPLQKTADESDLDDLLRRARGGDVLLRGRRGAGGARRP
jgi:hypothetical protein